MAGVLSHCAEAAYASKPNIQRPGSQADADLGEAAAATRDNDSYGTSIQPGQTAPLVSLGTADLTTVANLETTKYSIAHGSN